jgi:hypothetical protein
MRAVVRAEVQAGVASDIGVCGSWSCEAKKTKNRNNEVQPHREHGSTTISECLKSSMNAANGAIDASTHLV